MFKSILEKVPAYIDDLRGCVLLDADCVTIAETFQEGEEDRVQIPAVELASVIVSLRKRNALEDAGSIEEFAVRTDRLAVVARSLKNEHTLVLVLGPSADVGRAQTLLRLLEAWIEKLL